MTNVTPNAQLPLDFPSFMKMRQNLKHAMLLLDAILADSPSAGFSYDNSDSGLTAETVQDAIDELASADSDLIDIDATMAANSDVLVASQKATKTALALKFATADIDTDSTMAANSDAKVASQKATKTALATKPTAVLDTDVLMAANSDLRVPSQKAVKAYIDAAVA